MATTNTIPDKLFGLSFRKDTLIVIPTYNEVECIGELLDELAEYDYRAIVVDDSPTADTMRIAAAKDASIIWRASRKGLGTAIAEGIALARSLGATNAIVMDAGGTHRAKDVPALEVMVRYGAQDVVIGSRFVDCARFDERQPAGGAWRRKALSLTAAWLVRRLGINVADATSGFRCYRIDDRLMAALARCQAKGHAFQFELLTYLKCDGAKIIEVPIPYRVVGKTSLRLKTVVEAAWTYLRLVFITR